MTLSVTTKFSQNLSEVPEQQLRMEQCHLGCGRAARKVHASYKSAVA